MIGFVVYRRRIYCCMLRLQIEPSKIANSTKSSVRSSEVGIGLHDERENSVRKKEIMNFSMGTNYHPTQNGKNG